MRTFRLPPPSRVATRRLASTVCAVLAGVLLVFLVAAVWAAWFSPASLSRGWRPATVVTTTRPPSPPRIRLTSVDREDFLPQLYLSPKYRWGFCVPPKNSCTSFKVALARLEGIPYNETRQLHDKRRMPFTTGTSLPLSKVESILNDPSWTFVTVTRDPYERALSGYLNKFALDPEGLKKVGCAGYYHAQSTSWFTRKLPCPPSFKQFLQILSVTATSLQNEHFMPQSTMCQHGRIPYKYMMDMSEIENVVPRVLSELGLNAALVWPRKNVGGHESGARSMMCYPLHYGDEENLARVKRLYAADLQGTEWGRRVKEPACFSSR